MCERWGKKNKTKAAVSCSSLRLQGGISSRPSRALATKTPSSSKPNPMGGIQLVNLTFDTHCLQHRHATAPLLTSQRQRKSEWGYWLWAFKRRGNIWLPLKSVMEFRAVRSRECRPHDVHMLHRLQLLPMGCSGGRGVCHLKLKQVYCKFSIIRRGRAFNLSRSVTPPNGSIFETQLHTYFYRMTTKTYLSHQSIRCCRFALQMSDISEICSSHISRVENDISILLLLSWQLHKASWFLMDHNLKLR